MSLFVEADVQSPLGNIHLAFTNGEHVSATGGHTIREIDYNVHIHFFLVSGVWIVKEDMHAYISPALSNKNRSHWSQNRRHRSKKASLTLQKTVVEHYRAAVEAYLTAHPLVLQEAKEKSLVAEISSLDREINELQAKLAEKQKLRDAAQLKLKPTNSLDRFRFCDEKYA
jgi:uncharacterized small protein (DUF1192 family)